MRGVKLCDVAQRYRVGVMGCHEIAGLGCPKRVEGVTNNISTLGRIEVLSLRSYSMMKC